ncbi:MAG: pilus assembly protein [Alphaproteobacteria bacterium]|nr:MAG: pilus assembly protein [Alphaproteobacteria bacterium]
MTFARMVNLYRNQKGAAMVEAALVVPLLIFIFASIGQFGFLFAANSNMVDVVRETARTMAVGEITSSEANAFAQARLIYPLTYTVTATGNSGGGKDVTVTISAPYSEVAFLDIFGVFGDGNLSNTLTMRCESGTCD